MFEAVGCDDDVEVPGDGAVLGTDILITRMADLCLIDGGL